jgi:hypothetical protein
MTSTSTYVGEEIDQTTFDLELISPPPQLPQPDPVTPPQAKTPPQAEKFEIECLCPFCGSFNSQISQPCANCQQQDSVAARAATTRRQGPWYVLQENNPDAPGMNFDELVDLVRQQAVTSRSVVRGATTGQLWRLASRVRGLSREFGQCYSCAGDIDQDETICPHCDRVQTVLEHADVIPLPQKQAEPAEQEITYQESVQLNPAHRHAPQSEPVQQVKAAQRPAFKPRPPTVAIVEPIIHVHSLSHPDHTPVDPVQASRPVVAEAAERHVPKDDLLTPRDVAKAFQLEFGPDQLERLLARPNFTVKRIKIALTSTGALLMAALMLWPLTHAASNWINHTTSRAGASVTPSTFTNTTNTNTADARPATELAFAQPDRTEFSANDSGTFTPPPANNPASTPANTPAPTPTAATVTTPSMLPEPAPEASPQDDPRLLWNAALEAESTGNYAAAVQTYERIESLPSDSWPAHLETRLTLARRELKGDVR